MERVDSRVEKAIHIIRAHRVMLDTELAALYEVDTKALNQAVKRNIDRFPPDFMFQLTPEEAERSRSQFVTLNSQDTEMGRDRPRSRERLRLGGCPHPLRLRLGRIA